MNHPNNNRRREDSHTIEMVYDDALLAVLASIGITWTVARPPNGVAGVIKVELDGESDAVLEQVIGQLSDLRWRYTPGRVLQLELPRWDDATH